MCILRSGNTKSSCIFKKYWILNNNLTVMTQQRFLWDTNEKQERIHVTVQVNHIWDTSDCSENSALSDPKSPSPQTLQPRRHLELSDDMDTCTLTTGIFFISTICLTWRGSCMETDEHASSYGKKACATC